MVSYLDLNYISISISIEYSRLVHYWFVYRMKQCCVMCDESSWLVWNFNMVHFKFHVFGLVHIKMSMHSLCYEYSQSYTSFLKRRHYTSLKSSQLLQMYVVLISQGKESNFFWNVNVSFTKDVASCVHRYSRLRIKLRHQWSKYSIGKYIQFILVVKMTCWAMNWWNWRPFNVAMKTWVFPFWMPVIRKVKKFWMIGIYHVLVYSEYIQFDVTQYECFLIDCL